MHTLPSRSVNTFQSEGARRSSLTGMRYPRSSSLYLPHNEQNDESRSQLLPNEPYPGERRAQTLGRPQHHPHAAPSNNSRNMTNPLFDSTTSLDQPWYRGYGQPVSLSPPRINLPDQALDSTSGYGTVREMQPTIRVPSTRSPGRASAYSTSRRIDEHPVVPKRNWIGCTGLTCCEKEQSPYSTPDDLASSAGWTQTETTRPTQPWVICLFTVSAIFDLFLMILLAFVVFFLKSILIRQTVTYTFGLLAVMLLALILQAAIGRLRPEFIKICRPSPNVCPRWAALLKAAGYGFDLNDPDAFSSDPQLMTFLQQESARRGFYLVPRTTTPNPNVRNAGYAEEGVFSDADCTEKNVLRMKYARTSFPSLSASVTMYATIFLAAYITHTLRYLRRTCFCIPLTLLLSSCLVNLLLGLGRVVYRKNWLEDVLAGWALGLIVAAYVLYRTLKNKQNNKEVIMVSNAELQKQLHRIQHLLQTNQEYRQNEMKLMKYL
ncbi:hypothetical protein FGIG_04924 [Fasciola gigantica]|uniref:Phosphatidic acid phosphatase type 2/haloperoxidase domain-containing protein n=1 Tax=Fasciola gigantica TaxID=46835 RepID=A0A504Z511_FASGI|nr:hypothetical protein FGIG_04924 [Fasciola gigantica]